MINEEIEIESYWHAISTIDAGMWMLKDVMTKADNRRGVRSYMERIVDQSTGFDCSVHTEEEKNHLIDAINGIIKAKKYLEDSTHEEEVILKLLKDSVAEDEEKKDEPGEDKTEEDVETKSA